MASSADELDTWIRESSPRAVAFARSLVRDLHQAEDLVHDCYCRLLAKADQYDLPRDGTKLLLKSIVNATINFKTRRRALLRLSTADPDEADLDLPDRSTLPPDANLVVGELQTALAKALQALPPAQRAAIELKSLDYPQQDIADMLGVSVTNTGVLIHRARQSLAVALAPFLTPEEPQ